MLYFNGAYKKIPYQNRLAILLYPESIPLVGLESPRTSTAALVAAAMDATDGGGGGALASCLLLGDDLPLPGLGEDRPLPKVFGEERPPPPVVTGIPPPGSCCD